jgi:hypothetical protein
VSWPAGTRRTKNERRPWWWWWRWCICVSEPSLAKEKGIMWSMNKRARTKDRLLTAPQLNSWVITCCYSHIYIWHLVKYISSTCQCQKRYIYIILQKK